MRRTLIDLEDQTYVDPSKLTIGQYLTDQWLPAHRREIRANTLATYEMHVRAHILPHIGAVPLQDLTTGQVSALYSTLEERGFPGTHAAIRKTVRNVHMLLNRRSEMRLRGTDARRTRPRGRNLPPLPERPGLRQR